MSVLGAVIAGGMSTRYGSPKALAEVGGQRVIDRVIAAVRSVTADVVCIANDEELGRAIGLPFRPDVRAGAGPLGGLHAALLWAAERGDVGILAAGCDTPFVPAELFAAVLQRRSDGVDAVLPESTGRRGVEPLNAYYAVTCLPAVIAALDRGDHRMISFHADIRVRHVPLDIVRAIGDPDILFMNLNTPVDRTAADRIAGNEP